MLSVRTCGHCKYHDSPEDEQRHDVSHHPVSLAKYDALYSVIFNQQLAITLPMVKDLTLKCNIPCIVFLPVPMSTC